MQNQKIEEKIMDLMTRDDPKYPRRIELGGGYYFRCGWLKCNTDINRDMNFCPKCGQRINWSV